MDLCLDLCYFWGGWGKFSFKIISFFVAGVVFCKFFEDKLSLSFSFNLIFFLFCGGSLLFFFRYSLIHSHNFFCVYGRSAIVGQCAFLFWGKHKQLNKSFLKIWMALKRAGWCDLDRLGGLDCSL